MVDAWLPHHAESSVRQYPCEGIKHHVMPSYWTSVSQATILRNMSKISHLTTLLAPRINPSSSRPTGWSTQRLALNSNRLHILPALHLDVRSQIQASVRCPTSDSHSLQSTLLTTFSSSACHVARSNLQLTTSTSPRLLGFNRACCLCPTPARNHTIPSLLVPSIPVSPETLCNDSGHF